MTEQEEIRLRTLLGNMFKQVIHQQLDDIFVFKPGGYAHLLDGLIELYSKLEKK